MEIKLVVFDMAGTTVEDNNYVARALQGAFAHHDHHVSMEDINTVMGYAKPIAIKMVMDRYHIVSDNGLADEIHNRFVDDMVSFYQNDENIREKEHAQYTFDVLRKSGIKVAIDTGFSRVITDAIFQRLDWRQGIQFDTSITSDEVANGRPEPDMIFKAMELCGITDAYEVAKVGDTASDLQQGTAAGCRYVIGVTSGAYSEEDLSREKHTHLIADLKELLPLLQLQ